MHNLAQYPSITLQDHQVRGQLSIEGSNVVVNFEVSFTSGLNYSSKFTKDSIENWGLWEFDVVEVFLTRTGLGMPYLEVQVSPLGQTFALIVKEPRKEYTYPENLQLQVSNQVANGIWKSQIVIPLSQIPGEGDILKGNLHSCLGQTQARQYFGLNISDRIDFHRPEYFIELGRVQ